MSSKYVILVTTSDYKKIAYGTRRTLAYSEKNRGLAEARATLLRDEYGGDAEVEVLEIRGWPPS